MKNKKIIVLKKISGRFFKGHTSIDVDFLPQLNTICGENATGKTSVFDIFEWTLWGTDSQGNSNFAFRQVDETGKEVNNVDVVGLVDLDVNGTSVEFKKTSKQKWVKKRGSTAPTYEGNQNSYEVDGFPVSEKEYKSKIDEIISQSDFKLVSDIGYFSSLPWKDKRTLLLRLCGDVTDEDVINSRPEYWDPIKKDVLAAGAEKAKEKARKELKELNKTQRELPVRIDELSRQLRDDVPVEGLLNGMEATRKETDSLPEIKVVDLSAENARLREINNEISALKAADVEKNASGKSAAYKALLDAQMETNRKEDRISALTRKLKELNSRATSITATLNDLKVVYEEAKSRQFDSKSTYCQTCGQILPKNKVESIQENFTAKKNADASKALNAGKEARAELDRTKAEMAEINEEIKTSQADLEKSKAELDNLRESYNAMLGMNSPENPEIEKLSKEMVDIENRKAKIEEENREQNALIENQRKAIAEQLDGIKNQIAKANAINVHNEEMRNRIAEITALQRETGQKIALSERKMILLEEFSVEKSELLSKRITGCFAFTNFSLFNVQINGGISEECEITYKGVKYRDMNSGHRIACGLDIIKTFQDKIGIYAPVFVDNAESINEKNIVDMDCQLILLKVTDDKQLKIN